jgi:hypothetical protein
MHNLKFTVMKAPFLKLILIACFFSALTLPNASCSNLSTSSKTTGDSTDTNPPSRMAPIDTLMPRDSTDTNPPGLKPKETITPLKHDSTDGNPPSTKMKKKPTA